MIEADYRMKRIAIGVEPPPVRMTTFAAALTSASHQALQRWWFTPAYDGVHASPDRLAMQITGQGVQLQTEHKTVLGDGTIIDAALKPTRATRAFATSFTKRYDDIASASPIYVQLRQLTDFLIAAAYIRQHDWYAKANWRPAELLDENVYAVNTLATPVSASVVVNAFWKQQRMFTPAGGGVSIEADKAIADIIDDQALAATRESNRPRDGATDWWWD